MKLKQICNFAPGKATSPKLVTLKEQIEEIIESGNKVIVFSQFVDEGVAKLEHALRVYGTAKIVGGQTDIVRSREIERFKRSPDVQILIASVRSGGEGLNLTEASYVIHFDHWWNPAVMWQAEDRVHRRGQLRGVNVYSYWIADTIDQRIHDVLETKGLLFHSIVDSVSEEQINAQISEDEWLEILGVKRVKTEPPKVETAYWQSMSLIEIRDKLLTVTPKEFEQLVQRLMHYWGHPNVIVTGRSGDGGIDVISTRNTGQGVESVAAQCKRYRSNVGVNIARDFLGAIKDRGITKGYLITTGEFTSDCLYFCERNGITAIAGLEIAKYVQRFGLKT